MKAFKHLIKHALGRNCTVSVWDGEEWQVKRSSRYSEIVAAVESVEEAALRIRDAQGETIVQSVTVSSFGLADDETIIDNTVCPFMEEWEEIYEATI